MITSANYSTHQMRKRRDKQELNERKQSFQHLLFYFELISFQKKNNSESLRRGSFALSDEIM